MRHLAIHPHKGVTAYHTIFFAFSCIVLFLYGLKGFSREIEETGGDTLRFRLTHITNNRWKALGLGALFTAVIQSSSAVSSMTVALVDAGAFSFANSLAVLLGAGIGTTSTAWLVSLNFTSAGVYFIVFGTLIGALPFRVSLVGKSLFYFGFILFALELLSSALTPVKESPAVMDYLAGTDSIFIALLAGALITAIVQSSSVVSGLAVVLAQSALIELPEAVAVIIGAKVGSTSTALIVSLKMKKGARLSALSNFIFNLIGAVIFIPLIHPLSGLVSGWTDDAGYRVATAHVIFSVSIAVFFLPFLKPFSRRMLQWMPIDDPNGPPNIRG